MVEEEEQRGGGASQNHFFIFGEIMKKGRGREGRGMCFWGYVSEDPYSVLEWGGVFVI